MEEKKETVKKAMFLVNRKGFPLSPDSIDELWTNIKDIYPAGEKYEAEIRRNASLPKVSIPVLPSFNPAISTIEKLGNIQQFLNQLQYNHTGMQFFEIKKYRPISGLMEAAREIIKESLPIKCLEAVILSTYLTSGILGLERFTISFKSKFGKNIHRHVVLGLCCDSSYGALGMSRRKELMDKPLSFKSLASLIIDYKEAYGRCHHVLKKVKLSLPIDHDLHSCKRIHWKYFILPISQMSNEKIKVALDKFSKDLKIM